MFYNTTNAQGSSLKSYSDKAESQKDKVAAFFKSNPGLQMTPFDVQDEVLHGSPITSVRRAMTDLCNEGVLEKLLVQKLGSYGRPNCVWKLATHNF